MFKVKIVETVTCKNCCRELGKLVEANNLMFFMMGNILCNEIHGVCFNCGKHIHWQLSERVMEKWLAEINS
jgi:hypothetical protein